jgi:hypothetical protein
MSDQISILTDPAGTMTSENPFIAIFMNILIL